MTDLIERLRSPVLHLTDELLDGAADEIEKLRAAVAVVANGDEPRPVGKVYRADGVHSKHDFCTHGNAMYEDCGQCVREYALAAIKDSK